MSLRLHEIKPSLVLLQIGGNDLDSNQFHIRQYKLASHIFSLSQWIVNGHSVPRVGVMQLLYRNKTRVVNVADYNKAVDSVNTKLQSLCEVSDTSFFWRHNGLKAGLCPDGVHLNQIGMRKYLFSVRGAILFGSRAGFVHAD